MRALVLRAAGTNCDEETCRGFELAGAEPELAHLDTVIRQPDRLDRADLIAFPGGFSYGDDIASGRVFAVKVRERLYPRLRDAVERGVPIIGICNGFQVLAQCGLLPGPDAGEPWPQTPPSPTFALSDNAAGCYVDRWVGVRADPASPCVWTRSWNDLTDKRVAMLPVGHGEGRFVAEPPVLDHLETSGRACLRYTDNPNGSARDIAGVCDATGLVFGLMPHPDRFLAWNRHPFWTRLDPADRSGLAPGVRMFRSAVEAAHQRTLV